MLLKIMQFCIVVAVVGSNGQFHWTPNGYVAGLAGVLAAFLATMLVMGASHLFLLLKQKLGDQRLPGGRAVGQRPVHELVGEIGLDRRGHHGPPRDCLGDPEQPRIEQMKGVRPLRGP